MQLKVINPRTGTPDYTLQPPDYDALQDICHSMRHHQAVWASKNVDDRIAQLKAWVDILQKSKEQIIDALVSDTGRYHESVLEFNLLPATVERWAKWAKDFFNAASSKNSQVPHIQIRQENVAYPLVAVISPWNFPLLLSIIDTIPALLGGSAVIVKPSEITPRFIKPLQQTIDQIEYLKDVFKYVEGDGSVGSQLITCADIICFTGSVPTGRKVYNKAAELFKPCFLELGGKDPAIILEGADIAKAAKSILWGSTVNNGHSCLSIERVYVQDSIFEPFIVLLKEAAEKVVIAYDDPRKGHLGPIISERQVQIINAHLADAIAKGARLITGDRECIRVNGGYYCRPTVLTDVNHDMLIMTEETFGPVIPVMSFRTEQEAIELANATQYGLSAAVFAADTAKALRIASSLYAGAISINECALTATVHDGEKNSFKMSGIGGTRMGPSALQRFMRKKAYLINNNPEDSPWWYRFSS